MRLNCILDTNSCIHLSNVYFKQNSLLEYLRGRADLKFSNEVGQELNDHRDKNIPSFIYRGNRRIRPLKFSIDEYEMRMVGKKLVSREKKGDKGEIDNFLISVDQTHFGRKCGLVFITDDKKATNGILKDWIESFPAISFWNSYDVILYLYAEGIIPTKDIAMDLIQDVINFSAPRVDARSPKTTAFIMDLKVRYNARVERISTLLK